MSKLVKPSDLTPHPKLGPDGILPPLSDEEYAGLVESIRKDGIMQPIVVAWPERVILDGHHRWRAAQEIGLEHVPVMTQEFGDDAAHLRLGLSLNFDRRHLTGAQKKAAAETLLRQDPKQSDRAVAVAVGLAPTTVGTVRADLEERGDVSKLDTRTDTTGREQPARKPRPTGSSAIKDRKPAKVSKADQLRQMREAEAERREAERAESARVDGGVVTPPQEASEQDVGRDTDVGTGTGGPEPRASSTDPGPGTAVLFVRSIVLPEPTEVDGMTEADVATVREAQAWCGRVIAEYAQRKIHVA